MSALVLDLGNFSRSFVTGKVEVPQKYPIDRGVGGKDQIGIYNGPSLGIEV